MAQLEIPNRALFKQPEVCEIASIQPYVLRSWEAEFPDLGVAKVAGGPRIYRRADVERVLRIKQLLYGEGLTLAGVRRKLTEEKPAAAAPDDAMPSLAEIYGMDARERILHVQRGLRELSAMLAKAPGQASASARTEEFELRVDTAPSVKPAKEPAREKEKSKRKK
jgi:DNA-binding transcriptional MerR regulator